MKTRDTSTPWRAAIHSRSGPYPGDGPYERIVCPSRSSAARADSARSSTARHSGAGTPRAKEIGAIPARLDGRQVDDEARAARLARLVAHIAAVSTSVGARDRQAETGTGDAVARDAGTREPLEERVLELVRDARARVLDRDAHGAVDDVCVHANRCLAVTESVRDEVRDDVVEDRRIDVHLDVGRIELDLIGPRAGGDRDDLLQPLAQPDALRPDRDRFGIEARQVEQLLDERGHAHRLLLERDAELRLLLVVEPVAEVVQRLDESVDRRHRCAQLMRGERDEVGHHLVGALEAEP